jgi:hypothetical protein
MKKKTLQQLGCLAVVCALSLPVLAQTSDSSPPESAATRLAGGKISREQLNFDMESVGKLLEASSAARQIDSSKAPEALARHNKARELYKQARSALSGGDLAKASGLLTEVRAAFFDAVRLAAPEEVTAKKLEADYRNRLDSVNALLGAYKRVAGEKGSASKTVNETVGQIEKSVAEAARMAQAGKFKEGRAELDRAYLVAKVGVSSLRSGDTLVRSLNFANKEEEYHYEIDRNDTHLMLVKVLLDEKRAANPMLEQQVQGFLTKSRELRQAAESAAAKRDHQQAIKLLEESTVELVRAIRNAGVYIPG